MTIKEQLKGRTPAQIQKIVLHNLKTYSEEWGNSSAAYNELDYYSFFEKFVQTKKRVLEIGSGIGYSTLKLIERGHKVVSIEDNRFCLKRTFDRVISASYGIEKLERGRLKTNNTTYSVEYSKLPKNFEQHNLLIEGNILDDSELLEWLPSLEKFDAVVCWLIATHPISEIRYGYEEFKQNSYKIELLSKLLKNSSHYLSSNGYFHMIERTSYPNSDQERELLVNEFIKKLGRNDDFEILDYEFKKISSGEVKNGVRLQATRIYDGYDPQEIELAFMSILLRKK